MIRILNLENIDFEKCFPLRPFFLQNGGGNPGEGETAIVLYTPYKKVILVSEIAKHC